MNYIAEINAFEQWLESNHLSANAQLLWYKLMQRFNKAGWQEWIQVDNLRLMAALQTSSEKTFIKCRDDLVKAGLIEFQRGKKGCPNKYKIISFTVENTVKNTVEMTVEKEVQTTVEMTVESADIDKQKHKQKQNIDTNVSCKVQQIADLYNSICTSYPKVTKLSEARKKAITARLRKYNIDDFEKLFLLAEESDFLKGANAKNWNANFDSLIQDSNMAKVLDGNYKNNSPQQQQPKTQNRFNNFHQRQYDFNELEKQLLG